MNILVIIMTLTPFLKLKELKTRFVVTTIPTIKNGENRNTAIIVDNSNGYTLFNIAL